MEWGILFMGSVGSGKTEAIRSLSDIEVLNTDVGATDETLLLKNNTTVSMDVGVLHLDSNDKLRLYGAPGQDRFDFMWDILVQQSKGLILLINHANPDPLADFQHYITALSNILTHRKVPLAIGITHVDETDNPSLQPYLDYLAKNPIPFVTGTPPICRIDARVKQDVKILMIAIAGMLEVHERLG
ncbi:MAG: GTP-binding protein [Acinetobacter sp.]|jgi:signal recognition particle receptor subunit beta|nr:MAG: GTP-binding protein [Acinetobacter sp.]